jgi:hypothetical protein
MGRGEVPNPQEIRNVPAAKYRYGNQNGAPGRGVSGGFERARTSGGSSQGDGSGGGEGFLAARKGAVLGARRMPLEVEGESSRLQKGQTASVSLISLEQPGQRVIIACRPRRNRR